MHHNTINVVDGYRSVADAFVVVKTEMNHEPCTYNINDDGDLF